MFFNRCMAISTIIFFLSVQPVFSQGHNFLELRHYRFGNMKSYQVYIGENLVYKLRGDLFYRHNQIVALQDSIIVFGNNAEIKFADLKKLRLYKNQHLTRNAQGLFMGLGFGFFPLNTLNQLITGNEPVVSPTAAAISCGLLGVGLFFREINFKRATLNKHNTLKIGSLDYENLDKK